MNSSAYYEALVRRDPSFDGTFWYGVKTTGVYCRPVCKSRRPLERNVAFFADPAAARAAGFRACKRCHPDEAAGMPQPAWLDAARDLLDASDDRLTLDDLAASVGVSRAHVQRSFAAAFGVSPRVYAAAARERRLRGHLRGGANVVDATYASGFGSGSRVYDANATTLGMTPARYRAGGGGTTIVYGIVASPLGRVLVATTERGIAHVALGDDESALERELRAEFPSATLTRADDRVESATSALVRYLAAEGPWPALPLDVRATAFQSRVWDALRRLAPGTTTSYSELARALGNPRATRAVARACATNPVALLIPCHRVVANDGALRGYKWGLERKRRLLELERTGT
jgi:AraC family transcriptional regulator of adaptative response/methylated-DNA-[protein]-cysteine methyltransferase